MQAWSAIQGPTLPGRRQPDQAPHLPAPKPRPQAALDRAVWLRQPADCRGGQAAGRLAPLTGWGRAEMNLSATGQRGQRQASEMDSSGGQCRRAVGMGRKGCGAARGTTIRTTPAPPTATTTIQTTATTTTGFVVWYCPRLHRIGRKQPQAHGPAAGAHGRQPEGEDDRDPFPATAIQPGWNGRIEKSPAWCGRQVRSQCTDRCRRPGRGNNSAGREPCPIAIIAR